MKQILVFVFPVFLSAFPIAAQNLVINGDFELYDSCPPFIGSVNGYLQSAYNPRTETTTDYYNACDIQPDPCIDWGHVGVPLNSLGYQDAQSGDAYIGLYLFWIGYEYREYIVVPLSNTLLKDSIYTISFYVSKPETMGQASDAIMVAFSDVPLPINTIEEGVLQMEGMKMADYPIADHENWVKLTKTFKANGNENYLVIGNFLHDEETLLEQVDFIPFDCGNGFLSQSPYDSYYYIDNVSVEKTNYQLFYPNVFTPNGDMVNDRFTGFTIGYEVLEANIMNRWGNIVYTVSGSEISWDGKSNDEECEEGNYYYSVELKDKQTNEIIQKQGFVSLLR